MITEKEKQNHEELFRLMQENPDLPVVPAVDCDVVGDGSGRWRGLWGEARVDEYLIINNKMYFKSVDDNVFDVLEAVLSYKAYKALSEDVDKCKPIYDALPWVKAIIVNIDSPD